MKVGEDAFPAGTFRQHLSQACQRRLVIEWHSGPAHPGVDLEVEWRGTESDPGVQRIEVADAGTRVGVQICARLLREKRSEDQEWAPDASTAQLQRFLDRRNAVS